MVTKKKENPQPSGRNKKVIEWERVDKYIAAGLKQHEIAAKLDLSVDTFLLRFKEEKLCDAPNFTEYAQRQKDKGDADFRLVQYDEALIKRNSKVLMHCFKHRLGEWDYRNEYTDSPKQQELDNDHEKIFLKSQLAQALEKIKSLESHDNKSETG